MSVFKDPGRLSPLEDAAVKFRKDRPANRSIVHDDPIVALDPQIEQDREKRSPTNFCFA